MVQIHVFFCHKHLLSMLAVVISTPQQSASHSQRQKGAAAVRWRGACEGATAAHLAKGLQNGKLGLIGLESSCNIMFPFSSLRQILVAFVCFHGFLSLSLSSTGLSFTFRNRNPVLKQTVETPCHMSSKSMQRSESQYLYVFVMVLIDLI